MHGIEYDPIHDEIVVPQQFGQAILTFRGGADGDEAPIRIIQGSRTQLISPDRLDVDPVNNEIIVPDRTKILVFPREANGNVAPIRVIENPEIQLNAREAAVDPTRDLLILSGSMVKGSESIPSIMMFGRTDNGNVKPRAVISGPRTGLWSGGGRMQVYPPRGLIFITVTMRGDGVESRASDRSYLGVWSVEDQGDVPPRWTIGGPNGMLQQPRGVALDPKNKSLIVSDKYLNAVLTYYFPEVF